MYVELLTYRFNIGTDEVLPAQPQFADGATEGNLMNAAIGVEGCRAHDPIFIAEREELFTGSCAEARNELLCLLGGQLCFRVLAETGVVARRHLALLDDFN